MLCPNCGRPMFMLVQASNGKVFYFCPPCDIEIPTKDLAPAPYDKWEKGEEDEKV